MAGEDQERFEDYLELERYIEELQAGHAAHPPKEMTPGQASIYQMAALFRSAIPDAAEPHPDFAEQLKARLLAGEAQEQLPSDDERTHPLEGSGTVPVPQEAVKKTRNRVHFVSRRTLLAGGTVAAAASFAIGVGLDRAFNEQMDHQATADGTPDTPTSTPSTPQNAAIHLQGPTSWLFVMKLADLGSNAIRFTTDAIIGYVVRDATTSYAHAFHEPAIIAMSATCTHKGCIVQWEQTGHQFHCPCHDALFTSQGESIIHGRYTKPLPPLPRLNTKVVDGNIYVEVPASKS